MVCLGLVCLVNYIYLTCGDSSGFDCQGSRNGRVDYRGYSEAILKTYAFTRRRLLQISNPAFIEVGDFVERDEEIATIETDKVRPSHLISTLYFLANVWSYYRSMSRSTPQSPALSRNSSSTKKTPLPWDKISSSLNLEPEAAPRARKHQRNPQRRSPLPRKLRRRRPQSQKPQPSPRRSQSKNKNSLPSPPLPSHRNLSPLSLPRPEPVKSVAYVKSRIIQDFSS